MNALSTQGVTAFSTSSINMWVPVTDETYVAQLLLQAGWLVTPGHRYRLQNLPAIRITISTLTEKYAEHNEKKVRDFIHGSGSSAGSYPELIQI